MFGTSARLASSDIEGVQVLDDCSSEGHTRLGELKLSSRLKQHALLTQLHARHGQKRRLSFLAS